MPTKLQNVLAHLQLLGSGQESPLSNAEAIELLTEAIEAPQFIVVNHEATFNEIKFTDADIVNKDNFIPAGEYNPHNIHPFLFHDHGFVICVVFAEHLQDALDEAADADKLDRYLIDEKGLEASDYPTLGTENEEGISRLGNASEPFDIESLGVIELPNPKFSFCAMFEAHQETTA